jgi:hypothetical protein
MAWIVLGNATDEHRQKLGQRAIAFCKRHNLEFNPDEYDGKDGWAAQAAIKLQIRKEAVYDTKYTEQLWKRVVARALGYPQATGIAYGKIGYSD